MVKQIIAAIVVVAALLLAYVFLTEPEPVRDTVSSWRMPELEQFDRLTMDRGELELVVDKVVDGWQIQEPRSVDANTRQMESVAGLFGDVDNRLIVDEQKEATPNNLSRYGFDADDTLRVTLFNGGEAAVSFVVGATEESPSGDQRTWIRPEDSDTLYRVNRDLRQVLDKDLSDWRNSEVLSLASAERDALDAIDVAYGERTLRFQKSVDDTGEDSWQLVQPADLEADPDLIARWVRQINRLNAADFADDVAIADAGLDDPLHVLTLHIGDETEYRLEFGSAYTSTAVDGGTVSAADGVEQRYVRLDDGPIFAISTRDADRLMKRSGDFRPTRVLELDRDAVRQIAVADRDGFEMLLVRNDLPEAAEGEAEDEEVEASWRMEQPERIDPVNMGEFRRILTNVVEVDARRFDDEIVAVDAGFDSPRRTLTLTLDDESQHVVAIGHPAEDLGEQVETSVDHYARVDDGLVFVLQDYKVRNLLKVADDLRPEPEPEE